MKIKKILITSAGVATAVNVISSLKQSKKYKCIIISAGINKFSAGMMLADKQYIVPQVIKKNYLSSIIDIIKREEIDFIFPLLSIENELFSSNKNLIEDLKCGILISDSKTSKICNNKLEFIRFLDRYNFSYPYTYFNKNEDLKFPVFLKPIEGSSSKNTFKIDSSFDFDYYIKKFPNSVIQEYISEKEYTVDCLSDKNCNSIVAVIRERILVKDGKSVIGKTIKNEKIKFEVERLLKKLRLIGPSNVQLFYCEKKEEIKFIEINPRLAAGGLPLSLGSGVNIPELMMRISDGENIYYQNYTQNTLMIRYLTEIFIYENDQSS